MTASESALLAKGNPTGVETEPASDADAKSDAESGNETRVEENENAEAQPSKADLSDLHVGGALRFNAFHKSWDPVNQDKLGEFDFDTFRVNVDGTHKGITTSLEYRFYSGYNMLHHGYVGYVFDSEVDLQVGVHRKPLGLLPYASHNWFFDITYYLGMEDDYDAGVKVIFPFERANLQLAFYKSDEGNYTGSSVDSARYSYDVVRSDETEIGGAGESGAWRNEEINQFNGRYAYTLVHHNVGSTEIGISGEYGGLYNSTTRETGNHWTVAGHANGNYGRFNIMLQALQYGFRPENPTDQDDRFIIMGAYDAPYKVASTGSIFLINVAYTLPFEDRIVDSIAFYNDYSHLSKEESGFADSQQNVIGMLISAGKLFTYVDAAFGRNHPWLSSNYTTALAEGDPDADWELRININIGYYF